MANKRKIEEEIETEGEQPEEQEFVVDVNIGEEPVNEESSSEEAVDERFFGDEEFVGAGGTNRTRTPVLELTGAGDGTSELEEEMQNTPRPANAINAAEEERKEFSYVKNAPEYSGTDYSRAVYDLMESEGVNLSTDRQRDITGMGMHRQPLVEEQRDVNLRRWQAENVWAGETGGGRGGDAEERVRDYQVQGKHELKRKDKLPFQE